jgi:hypothetical protein
VLLGTLVLASLLPAGCQSAQPAGQPTPPALPATSSGASLTAHVRQVTVRNDTSRTVGIWDCTSCRAEGFALVPGETTTLYAVPGAPLSIELHVVGDDGATRCIDLAHVERRRVRVAVSQASSCPA